MSPDNPAGLLRLADREFKQLTEAGLKHLR